MAQQKPEAVALLGGEDQAARDGEIERIRVRWKLADHRGEGAALERLGHGPKRIVGVADAQMGEVGEAEAELGKAGNGRVAAFPSGEIVLDQKDMLALGAGGEGAGKAGGGREVASRGRDDLMHGGARDATAQSFVQGLDIEGHRRAWGFLTVTRTASLQRRYGAP